MDQTSNHLPVSIVASHTEDQCQSVCCRISFWQAKCIHVAVTEINSPGQPATCCRCRTGNESAIHKALLGLSSLAPERLRNHYLSQDGQRQPSSSFSTYSTTTKQATSAHDLQSATLAAILMCPEERSAREEILLKLVSLLESTSGEQKLLVAASLYRCNFSLSNIHKAAVHSSESCHLTCRCARTSCDYESMLPCWHD